MASSHLLAPENNDSKSVQVQQKCVQSHTNVATKVDHTSAQSSDNSESEENLVTDTVFNSVNPTVIQNLNIEDSRNVHIGSNATLKIEKPVTLKRKIIKTTQQNSQVSFKQSALTNSNDRIMEEDLPLRQEVQDNLPTLMITRLQWQADPPLEKTLLTLPVPFVIISHTATETSTDSTVCMNLIKIIQRMHMGGRDWSDIGYNFVIGGDGHIYEGRGWNLIGAHAYGYNRYSIGVSILGTYTTSKPSQHQLRALRSLIALGVKLGKVKRNYKLIGHRQVAPTVSPGDALFAELRTWEHWTSDTTI